MVLPVESRNQGEHTLPSGNLAVCNVKTPCKKKTVSHQTKRAMYTIAYHSHGKSPTGITPVLSEHPKTPPPLRTTSAVHCRKIAANGEKGLLAGTDPWKTWCMFLETKNNVPIYLDSIDSHGPLCCKSCISCKISIDLLQYLQSKTAHKHWSMLLWLEFGAA